MSIANLFNNTVPENWSDSNRQIDLNSINLTKPVLLIYFCIIDFFIKKDFQY